MADFKFSLVFLSFLGHLFLFINLTDEPKHKVPSPPKDTHLTLGDKISSQNYVLNSWEVRLAGEQKFSLSNWSIGFGVNSKHIKSGWADWGFGWNQDSGDDSGLSHSLCWQIYALFCDCARWEKIRLAQPSQNERHHQMLPRQAAHLCHRCRTTLIQKRRLL